MTLYKTRTIIVAASDDDLDRMTVMDVWRAEIIVVGLEGGFYVQKPRGNTKLYGSVLEAISDLFDKE